MNHHSKLFNFVMLFKQGFKSLWTHLKAFMNQNSPVSGVCKALRQPGHRELNAHGVLQDCFSITASGSLLSQCIHPQCIYLSADFLQYTAKSSSSNSPTLKSFILKLNRVFSLSPSVDEPPENEIGSRTGPCGIPHQRDYKTSCFFTHLISPVTFVI